MFCSARVLLQRLLAFGSTVVSYTATIMVIGAKVASLGSFIISPLLTFQTATNFSDWIFDADYEFGIICILTSSSWCLVRLLRRFSLFFSISRIIFDRSMGFVSIDAKWSISYLSSIHYLVVSAREKLLLIITYFLCIFVC